MNVDGENRQIRSGRNFLIDVLIREQNRWKDGRKREKSGELRSSKLGIQLELNVRRPNSAAICHVHIV